MSREKEHRNRAILVHILSSDLAKIREVQYGTRGLFARTDVAALGASLSIKGLKPFKDALEKGGNLLDAGSGTGECLVYFSTFPVNVYGIEYEEKYVKEAESLLTNLDAMGLINKRKIKQVQGDFLAQESYENLGIKFEDINLFYHYWSYGQEDIRRLAELIKERSKPGTMILVCVDRRARGLEDQLTLIGTDANVRREGHIFRLYEKR